MKNVWGIFCRDVQKITASVVSVVVIIGLSLVPCLYAWFNIMSNADPYGPASTSNIKVVVANEDEGCELLGLHLSIGELVVEGIAGNDQMGWCFADSREEAMAGLYAGDYYAALIVPDDFTANFLSIIDGELVHPEVEYYENEKKNAIAPKITNKAKTAVQDQINGTIVEKVADAIKTVSSVFRAMGLEPDEIGDALTEKMDSACEKLDNTRKLVRSAKRLAVETTELLDVATITLDDAGQVMVDAGAVSHQLGNTADAVYDSSVTAQENIYQALDDIDKNVEELIALLGGWAGDPNIQNQLYDLLTQAQTSLDDFSARTYQLPDLDAAAMGAYIASLNALVPSIDSPDARTQFSSEAAALITEISTADEMLSAAQSALPNAVEQAYNVYLLISQGVEDITAELDALSAQLASALMSAYLSDAYAYLDALYAAPDNSDYALYLYDELSARAQDIAAIQPDASAALSDMYACIQSASQQVAQYTDSQGFYDQTLQMLDSIEQMLTNMQNMDGISAALQKQLGNMILRVQELREQIVQSSDPANAAGFIQQAEALRASLREAALTLNNAVNQQIQNAALDTQEVLYSIESVMQGAAQSASNMAGTVQRYAVAMSDLGLTLDEAAALTDEVYDYVLGMAEDVRRMVDSEAFRQLVDVLENNPEGLADYLVSPVDMRTVIVYEIADYGSAMSPYYIMLALFVGSLLTAAMIKAQIPYPEYQDIPQIQRYFGRLLLFLCIGLFQALVTSLGCLFYVRIQCVSPALFVLGCMLISFNFVMMNYSLLYALDNIGLGASVIIMVIQVAGSGGSYPIHVLPKVFQLMYPFMPFHYGMDLVRETIGGFYEGTYLRCALILLGMGVVFFLIGVTLYRPAKRLNEIIAKSKEESGVM